MRHIDMENEVLAFIGEFSSVKDFFLNGKCYWFAKILSIRFPNGEIKYNKIDNHWATLIEGHLYDASGEITLGGFEEWPIRQEMESSYYKGLVRNCINFWGE